MKRSTELCRVVIALLAFATGIACGVDSHSAGSGPHLAKRSDRDLVTTGVRDEADDDPDEPDVDASEPDGACPSELTASPDDVSVAFDCGVEAPEAESDEEPEQGPAEVVSVER